MKSTKSFKAFIKLKSSLVYGLPFLLIVLVLLFAFNYDFGNKNNIVSKIKNSQVIKSAKEIISSTNIPKVYGANFDLAYKKIPANKKDIEFYLGTSIDQKTVNSKTFQIFPKKEGKIIVEKNIVKYVFNKNLKPGEKLDIFLSKDIKSVSGKNLQKDYEFGIIVVDEAKVIKFFPKIKSGDYLENLNQKILVFFNMPVVNLTDLDSRDKLPCPLEINPEIDGTCKWLTTSVLEFKPKKRFAESSEYKINIVNKKGLLYKIKNDSFVIKTARLKFYLENFNPEKGLFLNSNFPVDLESLKQNIEFYEINEANKNSKIEKFIKKDILLKKINDTKFQILTSSNSKFSYSSKYKIVLNPGIKPVFGNQVTEKKQELRVYSLAFLENIYIEKKILSASGVVINTISNRYHTISGLNTIGLKNYNIGLRFANDVDLKNLDISFIDIKTNKKIGIKLSYKIQKYYKENSTKQETKILKNFVLVDFKEKLGIDKKYKLVIKNPNLEKSIEKIFITPKKLEVKDLKILNYKKICVYTNNKIFNAWQKKDNFLQIFPKAKVTYISEGKDYPNYNLKQKYNFSKIPDSVLEKNGYCRDPKNNEYLYIVRVQLIPKVKYKIGINPKLEDIFGTTLSKNIEKTFSFDKIKDEDKSIYFLNSDYISTIPIDAPINFGVESINMSNVNFVISELSVKDYLETKAYRQASKFEYQTGVVEKLKNKNWNTSVNIFSLEKILKRKPKTNIVQIGAINIGVNQKNGEFINYIRSNLSILAEVDKENPILFITDFNGKTVSDLVLEFYSVKYDNKGNIVKVEKKDIKYEPKNNGVYTLSGLNSKDFGYTRNIIIVAKDPLKGYFGLLDSRINGVSNYDFKYISGVSTNQIDYLYLYTERPIYKPGDKVFLKGIVRKFLPNGYFKSDIKEAKLELLDPDKKVIKTFSIKLDSFSNFSLDFVLPKDIATGKFTFRLKTGKDTIRNNASFFVEEYKKPVFKIKLETIPKNKNNFVLGDKLNLLIKPVYYFGGKIKNTFGEYSILTQNYFFDAKDYGDYQFGEGYKYFDCLYWGYCDYEDRLEKTGDFKVDNLGIAKLNYDFPKDIKKAEKIYKFNIEIKDPDTSKVVNKTISKILHTTDAYVGLKGDYFVSKNSLLKAESIVLDWNAKPLKNKEVKFDLIKLDWKKVKKQGVDGVFYYEYELEKKVEQTKILKSDNFGKIKNISFKPKSTGEYLLKASYTGKNKKSFVSSLNYFVESQDYISWRNDNNSVTQLTPLKIKLNIGDTAKYILKSPVNSGKAIIFIEKDDKILDYFVHDIKTYSDIISLKVKPNYYPNYYLKAYLIGRKKGNILPTYKRALTQNKVNTNFKKLKIDLVLPKKNYSPRENLKFKIKVFDINNKPVNNADLSVSIVDESLLALKGNPKKNPYAFFYDLKRYLGVESFISLSNLVKSLEIKDIRSGEKGGSGDSVKGGDSKKKRGIFKDTAFFKASLKTNKFGEAIVDAGILPDNLTTWVIEVIGNTIDTKVGVAYTSIITSKELFINDNLPNYFGSNDEINLSPVVFNKTGKTQELKLILSGENFEVIGGKSKSFILEKNSSKTIDFKVKVKDIGILGKNNLAKVNFKLISNGTNKNLDEIEKFLQIKETSVKEVISTTGKVIDDSFKEVINLSNLKNKIGTLKINYSKTFLSSLLNSIDYLNNYPYGCSEQKTSAIMPNIYIKNLYNKANIEFDLSKKMIKKYAGKNKGYVEISLKEVIENYIANISKYQKLDGGFVYFYDIVNYSSDFSLTSYILDSLSKIRDIGFKVPEEVLIKSANYLKKRFYIGKRQDCYTTFCGYTIKSKLKALEALLSYNNDDYEVYKMYKILIGTKEKVFIDNLDEAVFLAKLAKNKNLSKEEKENLIKKIKSNLNKVINEKLAFTPRGAFIEGYDRIEKTAEFLKVISLTSLENFKDLDKIIDNTTRWLISQKKEDGSFGSTQKTIKVIEAFSLYLENSKQLDFKEDLVKILLNSKIISQTNFNSKNKLEVINKIIPLKNLKEKNEFTINKTGSGVVYYDLVMGYFLDSKNIKARDEGFFVEKKYFNYDDYKDLENKKLKEQKDLLAGKINYDDLKYTGNFDEYLIPVKNPKIGDLLVVYNKIIVPNSRDKVFFEGFIPSGASLINPNLDTSTKKKIGDYNELSWDKKEFRLDRFFGYKRSLEVGEYYFTYLIRVNYSGKFNIKPTKIQEFYNEEVFGRTSGDIIEFKK